MSNDKPVADREMFTLDWYLSLDDDVRHMPMFQVLDGYIQMRNQLRALSSQQPVAYQDDEEAAYEIGKRDGYEEAIQHLDMATGGDGEYRGSTFPGETVDMPVMKQRIIDRFNEQQPVAATGEDEVVRSVVKACRKWMIRWANKHDCRISVSEDDLINEYRAAQRTAQADGGMDE